MKKAGLSVKKSKTAHLHTIQSSKPFLFKMKLELEILLILIWPQDVSQCI